MSILPDLSEAQEDLAARDQLILQAAEATHNLASVLAATSERFYSLPTERLLAVLNDDVAKSIATAQASRALAIAVNAPLDAIKRKEFPRRAPTESPRPDIVFDGAAFVHVPPEPEPEPTA